MITATDINCDLRNNPRVMIGYPWIREWLEEMDATQAKLARALGLDGPKMTRVIDGERKFSAREASAAANFFSCTVEEVMGGHKLKKGAVEITPKKNEAQTEPQIVYESENAIAHMAAGILQMLINDDAVDREEVNEYFNYLSRHYAKYQQYDDLRLLGRVRDALHDEGDAAPIRVLQHILSRRPAGSA